jgi:1,4-alpha-glucan branching enzyme
VGNRAFGERIGHLVEPRALRAAAACVLLAPSPPLLFMGEEFGASTPFLFFCDFGPELAAAVADGRRRDFARFHRFRDPAAREAIPDPNDVKTFESSRLDWHELRASPHDDWLDFYRKCLRLRSTYVMPRLARMPPSGTYAVERDDVLCASWTLGDGSILRLTANFGPVLQHRVRQEGKVIYATDHEGEREGEHLLLPFSVLFTLAEGR